MTEQLELPSVENAPRVYRTYAGRLHTTPSRWCKVADLSGVLSERHYLGPTRRGYGWHDESGCLVVAAPTSRLLPIEWMELTRWCITDDSQNAGSRQHARFRRDFVKRFPSVTTLVSYSDPSVGHDGALYRACGWVWAPTWHRLRPPPSGNGRWSGDRVESVKDRWVLLLRRDAQRVRILRARDKSVLKRFPCCEYAEPKGADFKQWRAHRYSRIESVVDDWPGEREEEVIRSPLLCG